MALVQERIDNIPTLNFDAVIVGGGGSGMEHLYSWLKAV